MQNPSAIRTRPRAAALPARELSWSFMLLLIVCGCLVATGFFFAARQHFTSMEYGLKNSKLRQQLQDLETEKRRLLLAREVAISPISIKKAAHALGLRENSDVAAVTISNKPKDETSAGSRAVISNASTTKSTDVPRVERTVLTSPVQIKATTGETRTRTVETASPKKDRTEVAALLKLR